MSAQAIKSTVPEKYRAVMEALTGPAGRLEIGSDAVVTVKATTQPIVPEQPLFCPGGEGSCLVVMKM